MLKESELKDASKQIFEKGDKGYYNRVVSYFVENADYESTLNYSLIMAYKYNDADAYFDLYETMIRINNKGEFDYNLIKNISNDSKEFALKCLIKSSDLNDIDAKVYLIKYYREGIYLPKDIEKAEILEAEIDSAINR